MACELHLNKVVLGFPDYSVVKYLPANAGYVREVDSISGLRKSPEV